MFNISKIHTLHVLQDSDNENCRNIRKLQVLCPKTSYYKDFNSSNIINIIMDCTVNLTLIALWISINEHSRQLHLYTKPALSTNHFHRIDHYDKKRNN